MNPSMEGTSMKKRISGILLHITSLPSRYGIGDLGPGAYQFVDFLASSGQNLWQILPLNPTDGACGNSPYSSFSAFGLNTLLISPDLLLDDGYLTKSDLKNIPKSRRIQLIGLLRHFQSLIILLIL